MMDDLIRRQDAIDASRKETVSTNPNDFDAHEKFIPFMNDREISSFGKWQWANGFNTALVQMEINIGQLPSAQPEPNYDEWCDDCKEYDHEKHCCPRWNRVIRETLKDAQPERKTEKALRLLLEWAIECGFGYDNIPEEYEKYKDEVESMSYTDGLIYIAKMEVEHDG